MKRTLLLTLDFPPATGGVANYWANLARELPSDQFFVLAPEGDNSLDFDTRQEYLIFRKNLLTKNNLVWPRWLPFLIESARLVRQEKIEVLIATQVLPGGTIALILKKIFHCRYFLSFHGLDLALAQATPWKKFLLRLIIKNAEQLIVNSEFTGQKILALGINKPTTVVYPCPNISPADLDGLAEEKIKARFDLDDRRVILSVGRLVERKGFDKVLESLPLVLARGLDLRYVIVGRGADESRLRELIVRFHLEKRVFIVSDVLDDELGAYYNLAEVFIMPSRELPNGDVEGFGLVYLEANAFGKPVIAGRAGGAVEAVEHNVNGLVVDPENENEISQALISFLDNPQKARQFGDRGRARVEDKFQWSIQAEKLQRILE
jgi:phosphatidylinositol alpha-1,6-mannosyltransferase